MVAAGSIAAAVASSNYRKRKAQLRGKVVLITGGSRGLGLALAEEFSRSGAKLVLAARDVEELSRAKELLASGASVTADQIQTVQTDLREREQAVSLIDSATKTFGRIDILVNNAGVIAVAPLEQQTNEIFRNVMNTNFFTAVHCSLAVLPQMRARGDGTIVNVASLGGKVAVPHMLSYTASKFAEVGFSQGLHAELRSKGVHVLTVCPGLMRTALISMLCFRATHPANIGGSAYSQACPVSPSLPSMRRGGLCALYC
jgi:NAD(P)-dependent dehydrogenase (short-subunit alcohol dehydrogenase family)